VKTAVVLLTLALLPLGAAVAQTSPPPAAPAPPAGCDSPESHQFDFWVGSWAVSPTSQPDKHIADSLIEKLYLGCGVRENWMPLKGGGGGSLNIYVPAEKAWRQTWIDSSGSRAEFKGGWTGTAMVLTGVWPQPGHETQLTRMTYAPAAGGAVRQAGETSDDGGKTWQPSFDFLYRKAP
jgi:hypothetical protein